MTQKQLDESTAHLQEKGFDAPEIGIVLGTGLGKLADAIEDPSTAHYNHIPFFPLATVEFHSGKLIYGTLEAKKTVVMQGRFHLYEGYDFLDITYPIRVMHQLGIKKLFISNASGAINLDFAYRRPDAHRGSYQPSGRFALGLWERNPVRHPVYRYGRTLRPGHA